MKIKRSTFNELRGDPALQKALAIAIYLKSLFGRTSTLHHWTYNKLHRISRISAATLRKYLPVMTRHGWVCFHGRDNEHLVISRLASHSSGRNIRIDEFLLTSFKDTYRSLRAFVALAVQARKDYVRHTIQTYRSPSSADELRRARKNMKRLVRQGVLKGLDDEFVELGLSLKRIAKETGNCIRTAQRIMRFAIDMSWCRRKVNRELYQLKGVCFRDTDGLFTYSTRDYVVLMRANNYFLKEDIAESLGMVFYSR